MRVFPVMGRRLIAIAVLVAVTACSDLEGLPPAEPGFDHQAPDYQIGPGDSLDVFVWRNPEISRGVTVRPDGRISIPLLEDHVVAGKTPSEVSRELESEFSVFIKDPLVTVIVNSFVGVFDQTIRVVGQAQQPRSIPYRANMTLLDVMIAVGGLTEFAAGNNSTLVRVVGEEQKQFRVRLDDLLKDGEISANVAVLPGDIVIIPETFF
jgi:polysaccharide biosynthesis/export protein